MSATYDVTVSSRNAVAWVIGVGASRGTGAAVARRFAREGFMVAVTGRSAGSVQAVADEIKADGGRAIEAVGDAQDEAGIIAILGRIETIGPVEVGIYNAGNAIWGPPLSTQSADFEAMWRVGCLGGFIFAREVARVMLQRGRGTIIFTGASASLRGKGGVRRVRRREIRLAYRQPIFRSRARSARNSCCPCDCRRLHRWG